MVFSGSPQVGIYGSGYGCGSDTDISLVVKDASHPTDGSNFLSPSSSSSGFSVVTE